jgi:hypothetical protein
MNVRRYPLAGGRELRSTRAHGRIFLAVHLVGGGSVSGAMAIREDELDTLRSALADLSGETGAEEATSDGQALRQRDVSRGGGTSL